MSTLYGILGMQDRDTTVDQIGQESVYDAVNQLATMYEQDVNKASAVFIQDETTNYLEKIKLPGGGMMQDSDRLSTPDSVKRTGGYDVAYPIYDARDALGYDDVSYAYMTLRELDAHLQTIFIRMLNWKRFKLLRALLNNTNEVVQDERFGAITVRRLANGDTQADGNNTLYPPVLGATNEATENHYLVSGYASSSISNSNNPFPTIKDELEEHFGEGNVIAFVNNAETAKIQALSSFVPVTAMHTVPGYAVTTMQGQTDTAESRIAQAIPGKLIGAVNDVLIHEWRYMPAGYVTALDTNQPGPLKRRVDAPASLRGFKLVSQIPGVPFTNSVWRLREGMAVAHRLNGVVMQLTTNGSYTTPTTYA